MRNFRSTEFLKPLKQLKATMLLLLALLFATLVQPTHAAPGRLGAAEDSCAASLKDLVLAGTDRSSFNHFKSRIKVNYSASNEDWFKEHVQDAFRRAVDEKLNWQLYHENGLAEGERIIWLQQGMLKELNDKMWDIGGTEYYLIQLDTALAKVLDANPHYGRIIHRNYKDRVVITSLSVKDFQSLVMSKVTQELVVEISKLRQTAGNGWEWTQYIRHGLKLGEGQSLDDAHFALQLGKLGKSFDDWRAETVDLRARLDFSLSQKGLTLSEALRRSRYYKADIDAFRSWMRSKGFSSKFADRVKYYARLTNIADFLPTAPLLSDADFQYLLRAKRALDVNQAEILHDIAKFKTLFRDTWDFRRATFIRDLRESHVVLATDISGLGEKALLARDKWVAGGATKSGIESVYNTTTDFLNNYYKDLHDSLASIVGGADNVKLYASGDDALWGLPRLTPEQKAKVHTLLEGKNDLYSLVTKIKNPGEAESVAEAIFEARDNLFKLKPVVKKSQFDE